jgi:hypothetical protein
MLHYLNAILNSTFLHSSNRLCPGTDEVSVTVTHNGTTMYVHRTFPSILDAARLQLITSEARC